MKTFIIKSNYEYKIKAEDRIDAITKWHERIGDELASNNEILINTLCESLFAEKVKKWYE